MSTRSPKSTATATLYRRSPWLALEWQADHLFVVIARTGTRVEIEPVLVDLLARLGDWTDPQSLPAAGLTISRQSLRRLTELGLVESHAAGSDPPRGTGACWHPFDLDVVRIQSEGSTTVRAGSPPPAFKPRPVGARVALPREPAATMPLHFALEQRKTVRAFGQGEITAGQLGALLYQSARVISVHSDDELGDIAFRAFPAGGARSELEVYVVADRVAGLTPGAHYYDARAHELVFLRRRDEAQAQLHSWLQTATGVARATPPQAVLIVTAVFARVMWKYGRFGLTLTYQNLGCLYQTLYLVSTALGLAPCAIGAGRALQTARWLGLDAVEETPLGYFLVGLPAEADLR